MTREETDKWQETYADESEQQRRREQMPPKLKLLGLLDSDHETQILDLCCGHGETLDCLFENGFKNLKGIDLHLPDKVAEDKRFKAKAGDATQTGYPDESFDWVICIHSLHHFANAENVEKLMNEVHRVLKPGGRFGVIDFPNSLQIRLAFWFFRQKPFLITPYLRFFGAIIQEEWSFLQYYLPQWPQVRKLLDDDPRFEQTVLEKQFFYYYRTIRKK